MAIRSQLGPIFHPFSLPWGQSRVPPANPHFSERAELELLVAPVLEGDVDRLADRGSRAAHVGVDVPEGVLQFRREPACVVRL
jgi:hypothetical protein